MNDWFDFVFPVPVKRLCKWPDGCLTLLAQANQGTLCFRHEALVRKSTLREQLEGRGIPQEARKRIPFGMSGSGL